MPESDRARRRAPAVVLGAVVVLLLAAGAAASSAAGPGAVAVAAAPQVRLVPADGATDVAPLAPISVEATGGALTDVALVAEDGTPVPGTLSPDGRTWTASTALAFGTTYRFAGSAIGEGGSVPVTGGFSVVDPSRLLRASTSIGDGAVVGIAAPIDIRFSGLVAEADRAAVERLLSVRTSVPVMGSWAWLPDTARTSRIHWRPAEYWPPGTKVHVEARLYGLDLGDTEFGAADLTSEFSIGRSQIVRADVKRHRMVVIRDGKEVSNVPASYGLESDPRRVTRGGIHVVMGKSRTELMTNRAYNYENVPMHWAVRISNNGEFIHANPASGYAQGRQNVTHGCVNLSTANARAYFNSVLYGDPVEVTGSHIQLSAADGDFYDWTIPWDEWRAMSALHGSENQLARMDGEASIQLPR
ncbi:L,D-transpeptidase [Pseudonocardia alaniniphila]|uniref:Ig-like domain-containing protein n=1 Tax=Pseudonocardia alaniniphila TaxID=75291 RepID=A0ABS9TAD9_9PSEU|nr:Ig-like domain-containing protein [Pseudonocardia alaniniphila]MCH6165476.1 Ig-like domain-containing protein [Pseudonocardia alaniniphila]